MTVRKSELKSFQGSILDEPQTGQVKSVSNAIKERLQSHCSFLEESNSQLKNNNEEAVQEIEDLQHEKKDLSEQLTEYRDKSDIIVGGKKFNL